MKFNIKHDNMRSEAITVEVALEIGYPLAVVGKALKFAARSEVARVANNYRAKLASTSAGKLAAYKIKSEIARNPDIADPEELGLIDREAAARNQTREDLLSIISDKAAFYRKIALLVEVIEAETNASIAAISDTDPDIEARIKDIFEAAKAEADTEFDAAMAQIQGI